MKKVIGICAVIGLLCKTREIKAKAWFKETHQHITETAIKLLEKEGKIKAFNFYKDYKEQIIAGSTEPDIPTDIDKGAGTHYYSCLNSNCKELSETKGYYKNANGKFSKSAMTMLEDNYTSALSLYKSGKIENAMYTFGRAIHFVSDMGCTVHVSNMKHQEKPTNTHHAYEKYINTLCKQYSAEKFDKRIQKAYDDNTFNTAIHKLIKSSSRFAETISNLDPKAFDDAGKSTISTVQQYVMALMLKFYHDCSNENGNFLLHKKFYTIKNEALGLCLTVTPKGLILQESNKDDEQKFQLYISDRGTFGLKVSDSGYVSDNCKGYDYLKIGGKPAQFRFAGFGNKRFRISVGGSNYEKVLSCNKLGNLTIADFSPENPAQIWIIC